MLKIFDQWKDKRNEAIVKVSHSREPLIKVNLDKMSDEQLDLAFISEVRRGDGEECPGNIFYE